MTIEFCLRMINRKSNILFSLFVVSIPALGQFSGMVEYIDAFKMKGPKPPVTATQLANYAGTKRTTGSLFTKMIPCNSLTTPKAG